MIIVSDAWKAAFPEARMGALVMRNVLNPITNANLEARKRDLEDRLRARFAGSGPDDLKALEEIAAYQSYYRRFGKSYHVLLQLESVALRGKSIPSVAALVAAMFLAELQNLLLTAGHDLAAVRPPALFDVATGNERFLKLNEQEQQLKAGDMMMVDGEGVISSVLYGPDHRTRITPSTRDVLFVVYAPTGIGENAVARHLETIRENVLLVAPRAETEQLRVFGPAGEPDRAPSPSSPS